MKIEGVYKDHLGNVRLTYADTDGNGSINPSSEIISEKNYYPFGLEHKGYNSDVTGNNNSVAHNFAYNGKETQVELGLNWIDYGARNYNASLGRWFNIDPLSEDYFNNSPYNYVANTPLVAYDPDGKRIAIVGNDEYRSQVLSRLFTLALNSETGASELMKAIKSDRTFTIFDPANSDDSGTLSPDHKNNRSLAFDLGQENESLDASNGRNGESLVSNSSTKLGHELSHFNTNESFSEKGQLLVNGRRHTSAISSSEVGAVETENKIRKELNLPQRTHYGGINVYGSQATKSTEYQGYYELTRKRNYAEIAKGTDSRQNFLRGNGIQAQQQDRRNDYFFRTRSILPFLKKPRPNKELSINKSN